MSHRGMVRLRAHLSLLNSWGIVSRRRGRHVWAFTAFMGLCQAGYIIPDSVAAQLGYSSDRVLRLGINSSTGGRVSVSNLTHPANPNGPYTFEDVLRLTPTADPGYQFVQWDGPVVTTMNGSMPVHQLTMHYDVYVEAIFAKTATATVTITSAANGSVVMSPPDGGGLARNGLSPDTYPRSQAVAQGTRVRLTAVPRGEYKFDRWVGTGVPAGQEKSNPLELTVNSNVQVGAQFVAHQMLAPALKQKPVKVYFQGLNVQRILHFGHNDSLLFMTTAPAAGQTPDQAFNAVKDYLCDLVDITQGLQIQRYNPASQSFRRENVDPPAPVINIDYFSTCAVPSDSAMLQSITADINAAGTAALQRHLENTFLHGRWTDPGDSANRLYFMKTNDLSLLSNPDSSFKAYVSTAINSRLSERPALGGLFMDDASAQPTLPSANVRYVQNQACFSASRTDLHAAYTFTDGPNNTTQVTLRKVPGALQAPPAATLLNGTTLIATDYVSTADGIGGNATYTCQATFTPRITQPDFTLTYAIGDMVICDPVVRNKWPSDTLETLSYIRSRVPADKLIVYNTRAHNAAGGNNFAFALNGTENEYFIHSFYYDANWRVAPGAWKEYIDDLANISQSRIYLAQSGSSEDLSGDGLYTHGPNIRKLAMFLFSSYLLGKGPYGYFNFDTPVSGQAGTNLLYFGFYDLDVQAPRSGYCVLGSDIPVQPSDPYVESIYVRSYDNALVLVNPAPLCSDGIDYALSNTGNYYNVKVAEDGTFRAYNKSTLEGTLAPQTAVIFARMASAANMPIITNQSATQQMVPIGGKISFFVAATGPGPLRYQWMFNGEPIPGATNAVYTVSGATLDQDGDYTVSVANDAGLAESASINLRVIIPPSVSSQPIAQSAKLGGTAFFHVVVAGSDPLTFQWRRNGVPLAEAPPFSNVSTQTLTITNVSASEQGLYNCLIVNPAGYSMTIAAELRIDDSIVSLAGAVSRRAHGASGMFDVEIPVWPTDECTVETRTDTTIVLTFDRVLTGEEQNALRVNGLLACGNGLTCSGDSVWFDAIPSPCQDYVITGMNLNPSTLKVGGLEGDTSHDGCTNVHDVVIVRNSLNQAINTANFQCDVNYDGRIDLFDVVWLINRSRE